MGQCFVPGTRSTPKPAGAQLMEGELVSSVPSGPGWGPGPLPPAIFPHPCEAEWFLTVAPTLSFYTPTLRAPPVIMRKLIFQRRGDMT